jgi:rhamnose transport system permease protein
MSESKGIVRIIEHEKKFNLRNFMYQWEWLLIALLIIINVVNSSLSPNYANFNNIMDAIQMFLDKAIIVFSMILVILLGDIDISVASTMALSSVIMGIAYANGMPMSLALCIGLLVGAFCGFMNGIILAKFKELSSVIVTLATMIIYRGVASILLEDKAAGNFPEWFQYFGWGKVASVPFILILFLIEGLVFAYLVHKTPFGRRVYAMGNNVTTSKYSGIKVDKIKVIIFTLNGVFAAVAGVFLASKMGSVRPSMAYGYELDVIAMVVLGGVSTAGGKGNVIGVILATFVVGLLRYGLGLVNVPSQTIMIIVGALLVIAVAIPNLKSSLSETKPFQYLFKKHK